MDAGMQAVNSGEPKSIGELQAAVFNPTSKVPFADVKGNEGRIQVCLKVSLVFMCCFCNRPVRAHAFVLALVLSELVGFVTCLAALFHLHALSICCHFEEQPKLGASVCATQVLSVDDEQVNQQVMQSLLWDQNYELVQMVSCNKQLKQMG